MVPAAQTTQLKLLLYRYPLVWFALAWSAGILLATMDRVSSLAYAAIALVAIAAALWLVCNRHNSSRLIKIALAILAVMAISAWQGKVFQASLPDSLAPLAKRQFQPVALRGTIVEAAVWSPNPYYRSSEPNSAPWMTSWRVQWDNLRELQEWRSIHGNSLLSTQGRVTDFLPGDRIEVFGSFNALSKPTNPGVPDFSKIAQRAGLHFFVRTDDATAIKRIGTTSRWPLQRLRGYAVRYVDAALHRFVGISQAPLAAAIVFGQRQQVDWESKQHLMATGTLHLLAISGLHVDMVAGSILILCQLLSLRRGSIAVLIIVGCAAYAGLAGGNPPVLRALITIVAFTLARFFGFAPRLFNILALAAVVLLWAAPDSLSNVGVQLSFLAVVTIGLCSRNHASARRSALESLLEDNLPQWRRWGLAVSRHLTAGLRVSFWVWLITVPIIWHHFHVISLVSIPLNVVLAMPLMVSLLTGLITPLVGWLPAVGRITGQITSISLSLIQWLVELSYTIPCGHMWLPSPPLWWSISFYIVALLWVVIGRGRWLRWLATILVLWMALGVSLFASGPRGFLGWPAHQSATASSAPMDVELRCTFIDVGHGTSAVIEMPDGRIWLYDAGHMGISERSHEAISSVLWSLPTARIDTLVISHADSDHYNAAPGLLQRFQIGRIVSTQRFWESTSFEVQLLHQAILNSQTPLETWNTQSNTVLTEPQVRIEVLHPPPGFQSESNNADSLCLQLDYAGVRLLLPGDIEGSGMVKLCENPPRRCEILMAPHHGSLSHDVSELLRWCKPEVVVISGNERASRPEVLQRYVAARQLGVTYTDGAVQIRVRGDGTVRSYRWNVDHWTDL